MVIYTEGDINNCAKKIVVLEKGRIVEQGTQAELLELNGFYRNLHDMQFSEDRKHKD